MNILVTGGAGFIGSALIRLLINETTYDILNLDRLSYASSLASLSAIQNSPRYRFQKGDIRDREMLKTIFEEFKPNAVIHLAAETHVDRSIDDPSSFVDHNVSGTLSLLEVTRHYWKKLSIEQRTAFRFVHVSTDEVFGSLTAEDNPFIPTTPYAPQSPYSASKASSDHLARAWHATYGLPVIVTNCSNNYGPYQFPEKLIPLTIIKALANESLPVYGRGENIRDWIHVEDHTRALLAAFTLGQPGQTYLIGANCERRNLEVVESICSALDQILSDPIGQKRRLITFVADRPGHDFRYAIDSSLTHSALNWKPQHNFTTGIYHTVAWYVEHREWWESILSHRYDGRRLGLTNS